MANKPKPPIERIVGIIGRELDPYIFRHRFPVGTIVKWMQQVGPDVLMVRRSEVPVPEELWVHVESSLEFQRCWLLIPLDDGEAFFTKFVTTPIETTRTGVPT